MLFAVVNNMLEYATNDYLLYIGHFALVARFSDLIGCNGAANAVPARTVDARMNVFLILEDIIFLMLEIDQGGKGVFLGLSSLIGW